MIINFLFFLHDRTQCIKIYFDVDDYDLIADSFVKVRTTYSVIALFKSNVIYEIKLSSQKN